VLAVLALASCGGRGREAGGEGTNAGSSTVAASEGGSTGGASETDAASSTGGETETGAETETGSETETGETGEPFDPTPSDVLGEIGCELELPGDSEALWQAFLDQREAWLHALSEPILACVENQDTDHPAFHGCIDWHSAVHATWALHALYRMTQEPAYLAAANQVLDPEGLAGELDDIASDNLPFVELMYGRAWFLLLARERELALDGQPGAMDLRPHAELVADQLEDFLAGLSPAQLENFVLADDYFNASWALLNLHRWATHVGDTGRAEWVELLVSEVVMPAVCPLVDELGFAEDFFPPCLHRALAVLSVLPPEQTAAWLEAELPEPGAFELAPLCEPAPAHVAGLNFSRAWGLWALWQASGEPHYRDLYVEHVWGHVAQPGYWAEDYWAHSHWIAQFGVHAIWMSW
jgi:hypothetical protein